LGYGTYSTGIIPTLIDNIQNIIQISAGFLHSLVIDKNYNVYSFGNNDVKLF
jgi:alpha-tubulin suppressor-like RCC1 family protein